MYTGMFIIFIWCVFRLCLYSRFCVKSFNELYSANSDLLFFCGLSCYCLVTLRSHSTLNWWVCASIMRLQSAVRSHVAIEELSVSVDNGYSL